MNIKRILQENEAFNKVEENIIQELANNAEIFVYTKGQPLSTKTSISSKVLIISSGEARLVGEDNGVPFTVTKYTRGGIIGLSPILRGKPSEEVNAISNLEAIAIDDTKIEQLYLTNKNFRNWCDTTLNVSEIYDIAEQLYKTRAKNDKSIQSEFKKLKERAKLVSVKNNESIKVEEGHNILISSKNVIAREIGEKVCNGDKLESCNAFSIRLISVPSNKGDEKKESMNIDDVGVTKKYENVRKKSAPLVPGLSSLELGNNPNIELIRADNKEREILACFEMIAKHLKVPYRRDAIEKGLNDYKKNNRPLTLQVCGSVITMLGLQSYGVKIKRDLLKRVPVPSLLIHEDNYSVLTKTNDKKLEIASPRKGWVLLKSENIEEHFEEEVEILVIDRGNTSPTKKFGISWFLPALKKYRGVLAQVLLASFVVQLFGLANPLLIQVIIDKVISQRSLDTLQVLGLALVVVTILGGLLGSVRTFLFTETTNRLDTRLGSEVLDHLLRLPLGYFDKRPLVSLEQELLS